MVSAEYCNSHTSDYSDKRTPPPTPTQTQPLKGYIKKGIGGYHFSLRNKKIDDPQVLDDPKGISIGSMDVDNPNVYNDKSGLLLI